MLYDAFLSYSHAADGKLAPALQSGLQQFAKSWNRLRAVRIFRDKTGLSATPSLWSAIEAALDNSRHFVLLASPRSAQSPWVQKEVEHWLTRHPSRSILVVLTDGDIVWSSSASDFDWQATTALPPALRGRLKQEPLWVDMRWAKMHEQLSLRNPEFRDLVADLSSALRGIPKDQLTGEDVRQHRKAVLLRRSALSGLTLLAVALSLTAIVAVGQRNLAVRNATLAKQNEQTAVANAERATKNETLAKENEQKAIANASLAKENEALATQNLELAQRNEAKAKHNQRQAELNAAEARRQSERSLARQLVAQSQSLQEQRKELPRATLIAIEALKRYPTAEIDHWLGNLLSILPLRTTQLDIGGPISHATFDAKASKLLARNMRRAQIWDLVAGRPIASIESGDGLSFDTMALSRDGKKFALAIDTKVVVYDASTGNELVSTNFKSDPRVETSALDFYEPHVMAFSPDNRLLAAGGRGDVTKVWDMESGKVHNLSHERANRSQNVTSLAFSSDGAYLASTRYWEVAVWSTHDWKRTTMDSPPRVTEVIFSPGPAHLLAGVGDSIALWIPPNGKRYKEMIHEGGSNRIAINGLREGDSMDPTHVLDGSLVAVAGRSQAIVWDVRASVSETAATEVAKVKHDGTILSVAFSRDARRLLTVSTDHTAGVWEVQGGKEIARMVGTSGLVAGEFISDNEAWIVDSSGMATAWDFSSGRREDGGRSRFVVTEDDAYGDTFDVWDLRERGGWFARKLVGNYLAVWTNEHQFLGARQLWNDEKQIGLIVEELNEAKQVLLLKQDDLDRVLGESARSGIRRPSVLFSSDGKWVVVAGSAAWEIASGRRLDVGGERLHALVFSPDFRRAVGIEEDGSLRIVEVPSGRLVNRIPAPGTAHSAELEFSPDGRYIRKKRPKFGLWDLEPRIWDTRAKVGQAEVLTLEGQPVDADAFTADSKHVLKNDDGMNHIIAFNLETRRTREFKYGEQYVAHMAASPKEPLILIGFGDQIVLWDPRTGTERARFEHFNVMSVIFSRDGLYFAAVGGDGVMRVWETATRQELARVTQPTSEVTKPTLWKGIGFSSDNRYVGGVAWRPADRTRQACERLMRNLTPDEWRIHFENRPYEKTCSQFK